MLDIAISFDTTGSMRPAIAEVRSDGMYYIFLDYYVMMALIGFWKK